MDNIDFCSFPDVENYYGVYCACGKSITLPLNGFQRKQQPFRVITPIIG